MPMVWVSHNKGHPSRTLDPRGGSREVDAEDPPDCCFQVFSDSSCDYGPQSVQNNVGPERVLLKLYPMGQFATGQDGCYETVCESLHYGSFAREVHWEIGDSGQRAGKYGQVMFVLSQMWGDACAISF